MSQRMQRKVVAISGAARGQGRSHAVRLAEEGADIIAFDICDAVPAQASAPSSEADLAETIKQVKALGRRIIADKIDVRDGASVDAFIRRGAQELGGPDVVVANAGITPQGRRAHDVDERDWQSVIDTNLTGVFNTVAPAARLMIEHNRGGAIIMISSSLGLKPVPGLSAYVAAKSAMVGLMRTMALELGRHRIRVNTVHPTAVETDMLLNKANYEMFRPDLTDPTLEDALPKYHGLHVLPVPWVDPVDISNAVLYLGSDDGRYVTGTTMQVDAGITVK